MRTPAYNYIFAGTASTALARSLAKKLAIPLGNIERASFVNSEFRLRILERVNGKDCIVVQSTGNPTHDNLFELFLLVDALTRGGAKKVTMVTPYFGYSRQHRHFRSGEAVSSEVILRTLKMLGADKVITCDFHNLESIETSPLPITNVSALPLLARIARKRIDPKKAVVVSPDTGGIERAKLFAKTFFDGESERFTFAEKERSLHKTHHIKRITLDAPKLIAGNVAVIVDDICTSGKTLLSAAKLCVKHGATAVYAVVTHPDMDEQALAAIIASPLKAFFTTNSMGEKTFRKKITVDDVAEVIADALA